MQSIKSNIAYQQSASPIPPSFILICQLIYITVKYTDINPFGKLLVKLLAYLCRIKVAAVLRLILH